MNTADSRLLEATNRAERAELQARKELADCEKRLVAAEAERDGYINELGAAEERLAANKREHELEEDILRLTVRLHAAEKFVDHDMKRMEERLAAAERVVETARAFSGVCPDACEHDDCAEMRNSVAAYENLNSAKQEGE